MPPRGSRGGTRGRGRGRGRAATTTPAKDTDTPFDDDHASQSTLEDSIPRLARVGTPQNFPLDPQDEHSPNSSPATVPTETPAPTPAQTAASIKFVEMRSAGVGVLSSRGGKNVAGPPEGMVETPILPPNRASAVIRPEPVKVAEGGQTETSLGTGKEAALNSIRGRGRPGLASGRVKSVTESRFKPMNIRRDAGELEQLAKKEQMRLAGIAASSAREQARWLRGRGRPPRGRGDVMGRSAVTRTASGLFGALPEGTAKSSGRNPGRSAPSGVSGGGGGSGKSSGGGGSGSGISRTKQDSGTISHVYDQHTKDNYDPKYPDLDDSTAVNIEQINTLSDSSDEDVIFTDSRPVHRNKSSGNGLKPVRLYREEHKERVTIVNTETTIKISNSDDEDLPTINEALSTRRTAKEKAFKGVYSEPSQVSIKTEPHDDGPPSSPEDKRRVKGKARALSSTMDVESPDLTLKDDRKNSRPRQASRKLAKKPIIQTEEDREEYERHLEDVAVLASELGGLQGNLSSAVAPNLSTAANRPANVEEGGTDTDGDISMETPEENEKEKSDERSGRLYLFQFPPVLPELYNEAAGKPKSQVEIKKEEEDAIIAHPEAEAAANATSSKGKGKPKERIDLTTTTESSSAANTATPSNPIKIEDTDPTTTNTIMFPGKHTIKEEGWIGKLVVRKSGKVELNWGGTSLMVGKGVDAAFLTTGVLIDNPSSGKAGTGEGLGGSGSVQLSEGNAVGMGQIMGKFVVVPDWEAMT